MKKFKIYSVAILLVLLVGCAALFLSCDQQPAVTDPCANGHTEVTDAAVAATCTSKGLSEGKHCSVCNKVLTAQQPTEKAAHTTGEWVVTLEPTCTTKGSQYKKCTVCKEIVESQITEALSHAYGEPKVTKKPTCTQDGAQTVTCARCEEVTTEKIDALSHDVGEWVTDSDQIATCAQAGVETRTCKRCSNVVEIRSAPKLAHDLKEEIQVATVCGTAGSITRTCKRENCYYKEVEPLETVACTPGEPEVIVAAICGKEGVQQTACTVCRKITISVIPALSHRFGEPVTVNATCQAAGSITRACLNAGCTEKEVTPLPVLPHTPGAPVTVVSASCDQVGVQHVTCTVCGDVTINEIPALNHSFTAWVTDEDPTCTTTGLQHRTCTNAPCAVTEREVIPTAAHTYTAWVIDLEESCATPGLKHRDCTVCNKTVEVVTIEQKAHAYPDDYTVTANPTCATLGQKERTCPNCNTVEKASIPSIDHTPGGWALVLQATEFGNGTRKQSCTVCQTIIALEIIPATGDPVQLTYTVIDNKATVTGYTALAAEKLVIPATLGGAPVVKIAAGAFKNATRFTSITLPSSLTTVEQGAFEGCSLIKTEKGLTTLGGCLIAVDETLYEVTIPNTIKIVANGAFANCYKLVHVTAPQGLTLTDLPANKGQEIRTDSNFTNKITSSSGYVIFTVGSTQYLIAYTGSATKLDFEKFNAIYPYALAGNQTIKTLTIPESFTNIGANAFSNCKIETLTAGYEGVKHVALAHLKSLTVTGSGAMILSTLLDGAYSLEKLVLPADLPRGMGFKDCVNLKEVTGPAEIFTEAACAIYTKLEKLTINGGTAIAGKAFQGHANLKSVSIAPSVTTIGGQSFMGCSKLTTFVFSDIANSQFEKFGGNALCSTAITSLVLPENGKLTTIPSQLLLNCSNLTQFKIPDSVTTIKHQAFSKSGLTSITIPANVISLDEYDGDDNVRGIFVGCTKLTTVTFASGSKLTTIDNNTFNGCTALKSITIPSHVTKIGKGAFKGCTALTEIKFATTSGWFVTTNAAATSGTSVAVTTPATNANNFKSTYVTYYWKRS